MIKPNYILKDIRAFKNVSLFGSNSKNLGFLLFLNFLSALPKYHQWFFWWQWFCVWKFKNILQIHNLILSSCNSLCAGSCIFPWRWEIHHLLEWCSHVGKGEPILTSGDWNTTQPILMEGFSPCLIVFLRPFVSYYYLNLCCPKGRGLEEERGVEGSQLILIINFNK